MRDRLLVRHFLWRFVEHDLVSPDTDRHGILAMVGGAIVTVNLFLAAFAALMYQFDNFMPPGMVSISSLDDRFLFVSLTLLVAALAAVAQWDALVLDARDTAVLGVLPIPKSVIVRTKFAATALFGLGVIVASSLPHTLLRFAAIPIGLGIGVRDSMWLTITHGVATCAAGAFGFLSVLALRETLVALLGARRFRHVSGVLQGALVVGLTTALLLLPAQGRDVARRWLTPERATARMVPALWFVGLHETMGGSVFDSLPRTEPKRYLVVRERVATALYRSSWPVQRKLAPMAIAALLVVAVAVTLSCLWNNRRLPVAVGQTDRSGGALRRGLRRIVIRTVARGALQQAGFFLTLQTLSRRVTHRIPMAVAVALGLSLVVICASGSRPDDLSPAAIPSAVLAAQSLLLGSVVTAFRYATRLPAELRASSSFMLAWSGHAAPYISGVKRAGWVAIVLPSLALIAVWHVALLGPRLAVLHGLVGVALSALLMEALFLHTQRVPFASAHVPDVDAKSHAIIYGVALLIGSLAIAGLERWSFGAPERFVLFFATLIGLLAGMVTLARTAATATIALTPDEGPLLPTQRLNLAG